MCIRDRAKAIARSLERDLIRLQCYEGLDEAKALYEWEYAKQLLYTQMVKDRLNAVSYTHLRAHETVLDLVCRLLLEKKKTQTEHP